MTGQGEEIRRQIETFVVFDLETTGLSTNSARITEIAFVAVTRQDFLTSARNNCAFPRILSKLSLPVNPTVEIHPVAANVSGLTNELLIPYETFPSAFGVIAPFLARLPSPICFVAHNGRRFDFPLFKAELARYNLSLEREIMTLDTFILLQKIDACWINETQKLLNKNVQMEVRVEEIRQEVVISAEEDEITPIYSFTMNYGDRVESWRTPPKIQPENHPEINLNKPENGDQLPPNIPEPLNPNIPDQVFPEPPAKRIISQLSKLPSSYKQPEIYKRLFNEQPKNAHTAEGDCLALLQILLSYGDEFVKEADVCAKLF